VLIAAPAMLVFLGLLAHAVLDATWPVAAGSALVVSAVTSALTYRALLRGR
jgi:hypothetical protein